MAPAHASRQSAGSAISLTWNSSNANSCVASGGTPGDGWMGTLSTSGAMTVTETSVGTVTYSITCAGAPPAATASTSVVIKTAAAPPAATSTSHGGGGAVGDLFLLILGVPFLVSLGRAARYRRHESASQRIQILIEFSILEWVMPRFRSNDVTSKPKNQCLPHERLLGEMSF